MTHDTPITDSDLHAYLDGQLSEQRRRLVEVWLEKHPEVKRELQDHRVIGMGLHSLFDYMLAEPIPDRLNIKARQPAVYRFVAAVALMAVGGVLGWSIHFLTITTGQQLVQEQLVKPAGFAHYVYTSDTQRPVEVSAGDEYDLVSWLSRRMHSSMKAPDLSSRGFRLVGGRLLPSTNRMAAQFMYGNEAGERITLYIRRIAAINAEPVFRFTQQENTNTLYWIENEFGYAISGEHEKSVLLQIAELTHIQLKATK